MNEDLGTRLPGGLRDDAGGAALHDVEPLPAAFVQDADEVDHRAGAADGGLDRIRHADVGLHGVNLPDSAQRLQVAGKIRPAHANAHAVSALRQLPDHVAADESRAAENRDESSRCGLRGHLASCLPFACRLVRSTLACCAARLAPRMANADAALPKTMMSRPVI